MIPYRWVDGATDDGSDASDWSGEVVQTETSNATIAGVWPETVTIPSNQPADVLTVNGQSASVVELGAVSGTGGTGGTGALAGDSDSDGDTLTISAVSGDAGAVGSNVAGTYGHLTLNADGSYSYIADNSAAINAAATGSHAVDSFTYTVSDGHGGTTMATLNITLDRPPVVATETATVVALGTVGGTAGTGGTGALAGDSDPDGDALTITALAGGTVGSVDHGTYGDLILGADGSYSYSAGATATEVTNLAGAAGASPAVDSFNYTVSDGQGGTTSATLNISLLTYGAPVITAPASATAGQGQASPITGVSLAETGATAGETFTATLSDIDGLLGATGTGVTGSGGNSLTITGSLKQVNTDLASLTVSEASTGSDTITLNATDGFGGTASAASITLTTINQFHWLSAVGGTFATGADWSGDVAPGATSDDAILDATGGDYTVTASSSVTVGGVQTAANATLKVDDGAQFNALNGTDGGVSAGTIQVGDGSSSAFGGTLANSGTVALDGAASHAGLLIDTGGATLSGDGGVELGALGVIAGAAAGASLTNLDNTIAGGGFIESLLTLVNATEGVIDAAGGRMLINLAGGTVTNAGLIEATGPMGILLVNDTTIDSSGGGSVEAGKQVQLNEATLLGGFLTIDKGGLVISKAIAGMIDLGGGTVSNAGTLEGAGGGLIVDGDVANSGLVIAENGALTITGSVTGTGRIEVFGTGTLEIDGAQGGTIAFAAKSTGRLILGDSQAFSGTITGLSRTGANSIDLQDIDFAQVQTPIYVANTNPNTGGVLTVTDGIHTATIKLKGANYGSSAHFTLSQDSGTGTIVVDPPASAHAFVAAMAAFATAASAATGYSPHQATDLPMIARPGGAGI